MDTTLWSDDVWVADSTPVECGRSRETAKRSNVAGWAEYGLLRVAFPVLLGCGCTWCAPCPGRWSLFAIAGTKADERQTLPGMLDAARDVVETHPEQILIGDKNYFGKDFEAILPSTAWPCCAQPAAA